ncbi:YtzH-like family protein [Aureibacillus halotolerans]|uniref:YtzH-like protein n=1 Tax=Aureibacillus halotolerans TaxID=1508390 RepID=A0A4R6U3R5_9BACI|nr:YtzH-like family protein [Aureibacillus halotolerans]TDQ39065.1 YtzH-like protein [Aureibacillus halotolerans]
MPLTANDKLRILRDILITHQMDHAASSSEHAQIQRIAKRLAQDTAMPTESQTLLRDVLSYSELGASSMDQATHITSHEDKLNHWVSLLDQMQLHQ